MKPWVTWIAKSALTWAAVIGLLAVVFGLRYATVQGLFTSMAATRPGACRAIAAGLDGPSDFAIEPVHNVLLVSATNGHAPGTRDGIYLLKLNDPAAAPQKLAGTPANFHPGGISLYRAPDGGETLAVIDHKPSGRPMIETYDVHFDGETARLDPQTAIQSNTLYSAQGIALIGPGRFYATNDHATRGALGRFAEDYLFWPHADVVLANGLRFRIAVQRIAYPSGILARNGVLYVAASNERRLLAFSIEDFTGNLNEIGALSLPARLGHISADLAGNLIVAGQSRPGSAQVFRVRLDSKGIPQGYDTIFSDDGHDLKGASAAAIWNGQLLIGASGDSKMLACALK